MFFLWTSCFVKKKSILYIKEDSYVFRTKKQCNVCEMNIYVLQNDLKKKFKLPVDVLNVLTDKYNYQI